MHRNDLLIFILLLVNSLFLTSLAQARQDLADVDFFNIYNTGHTYLGIPIGDSIYIYAPPSSKKPNEWSSVTNLAIPEGTLAIDGNIRKNIFMSKKAIIFEEMGRYDTLHFQTELPPIDPRVWIRGPQSTEAESYFLLGERNISYYRDYDEREDRLAWHISDQLSPHLFKENRTHPILTDSDDFLKLYSFTPGGGLYIAALDNAGFFFYRYPTVHDELLGDEILEPAELSYPLPDRTITAFIYDSKYIAVVSQDQIAFYDFDIDQRKWVMADRILPFRFSTLDQSNDTPQVMPYESLDSKYAIEWVPGDSIRLISGDSYVINGRIAKKVDLNFDGLEDLIINFGQCGNWGDCLYGIYTQQSDGKYSCVFQPEYWYSGKWDLLENDYTQANGRRWMKIQLYSRTDYGGDPPGIVATSTLQFIDRNYQVVPNLFQSISDDFIE